VRWLNESLFAVAFDNSPLRPRSDGRVRSQPSTISNGCIFFWDKNREEDETLQLPVVEDPYQYVRLCFLIDLRQFQIFYSLFEIIFKFVNRFSIWHQTNPRLNPVARWYISKAPVRGTFCNDFVSFLLFNTNSLTYLYTHILSLVVFVLWGFQISVHLLLVNILLWSVVMVFCALSISKMKGTNISYCEHIHILFLVSLSLSLSFSPSFFMKVMH
jgi:hypothetical protein